MVKTTTLIHMLYITVCFTAVTTYILHYTQVRNPLFSNWKLKKFLFVHSYIKHCMNKFTQVSQIFIEKKGFSYIPYLLLSNSKQTVFVCNFFLNDLVIIFFSGDKYFFIKINFIHVWFHMFKKDLFGVPVPFFWKPVVMRELCTLFKFG